MKLKKRKRKRRRKKNVFFIKQKTAYEIYQCDWSSDVCSSDLIEKNKIQFPWEKGKKRMRLNIRINSLPITESGTYFFRIKYKKENEKSYKTSEMLPLDITFQTVSHKHRSTLIQKTTGLTEWSFVLSNN